MGITDISWRIWNAITGTRTLMGLNMVLSQAFSGWISGFNQIVVPNSITIFMDKSQLNKMWNQSLFSVLYFLLLFQFAHFFEWENKVQCVSRMLEYHKKSLKHFGKVFHAYFMRWFRKYVINLIYMMYFWGQAKTRQEIAAWYWLDGHSAQKVMRLISLHIFSISNDFK